MRCPKDDPATLDPEDKHKFKNATLPERVRVDAALADRLRAVPGVTKVVGEVSFPVQLGTASALGHAWDSAALTPYALTGEAPKPGEVVVDADMGIAAGTTLPVAAHGTIGQYRVSGVAKAPQSMRDPALFFAASDAERLSGHPGQFDAIGVFGGDAAAVSAVVGDAGVVTTGADRGALEFPEVGKSGENLIVLAAVSGGLSALVMVFVVAGTLTLSTQQRQRELALLRAIGTTPRQLRRMVLGEALVVGLLAVAVAVVLGPVLGKWLFDQLAANHVVAGRAAVRAGLAAGDGRRGRVAAGRLRGVLRGRPAGFEGPPDRGARRGGCRTALADADPADHRHPVLRAAERRWPSSRSP